LVPSFFSLRANVRRCNPTCRAMCSTEHRPFDNFDINMCLTTAV
jgi:hypothetical protein